jgi:hypothetical protein
MATQVRIVLDTGAFLPEKTSGQTYIDVGYFEPQRSSAIELFVDGVKVPIDDIKFGNKKDRIDIKHTDAGNNTKEGVNRLFGFTTDLLRKHELYNSPAPKFKEDAFDCILRLHSGDFDSADVRSISFKEYYLAGEIPTGRPPRTTRPIANDIVVDYKLDDGEAVKFTRGNDELLSTDKIGAGAKFIEIKILNDTSTVSKYCNQALDHTGQCCWLPNPNPPPVNG